MQTPGNEERIVARLPGPAVGQVPPVKYAAGREPSEVATFSLVLTLTLSLTSTRTQQGPTCSHVAINARATSVYTMRQRQPLSLILTLTQTLTLSLTLFLTLTLNTHKGILCTNDCAQVTTEDRTRLYQEYRLIRLDVSVYTCTLTP